MPSHDEKDAPKHLVHGHMLNEKRDIHKRKNTVSVALFILSFSYKIVFILAENLSSRYVLRCFLNVKKI